MFFRRAGNRLNIYCIVSYLFVIGTTCAIAGPGESENGIRFSSRESSEAFPRYLGISEREHFRKLESDRDLDPYRKLDEESLSHIRRLCDYLIDTRYRYLSRAEAARYLGIYGHSMAIPALLAVIRDEQEETRVRARSLLALGQIRDTRVVMWIVEEGLGSGKDDMIMSSMEALRILDDLPDGVVSVEYRGFRPPPGYTPMDTETENAGNPETLEPYLDIWRAWWRENHNKVRLQRPGGEI